ncbi:MAG: response regulator [Planctomycetota bacterium]|jgi:two-component system chemotaxis response regulator CheY|nr:response regulator [Planctomycetota bacterium]
MSKTVLVVDDSAMMRKIVIKNLKELRGDLEIMEAGDGKDALAAFSSNSIDMVITDWNMPNMSGIDLVKEIRKLDPDKKVPVVMVTSEATADKVKEAVMAGANNYIAKPFTPEGFKQKMGPMLGS